MKKTAVIILNYNNCKDTRKCVSSILQYNTAPVKIIVVDNASAQPERTALKEMLDEVCPEATLVQSESNLGYARGNNLGLQVAFADPEIDNVLILNNDVYFIEDIIPSLIDRMHSLPDCGIISPVLLKPNLTEIDTNCARKVETVDHMIAKNFKNYFWSMRGLSARDVQKDRYILADGLPDKQIIKVDLPSGSCMLIKKDVFKEIDGFDPTTFLYYEENILQKKLERLGLCCYICLDLKCVHLGAATTKQAPKSFSILKANIDSQKYYVRAYADDSAFKKAIYTLSANFYLATAWLQKKLYRK